MLRWLPKPSAFYKRKISRAVHSRFGGVTVSTWHLVHYSRLRDPVTVASLMTRDHYAQTLQSSLDDTLPRSGDAYTFETCSGQLHIGSVRLRKTGASLWVYDGDSLWVLICRLFLWLGFGSFGCELPRFAPNLMLPAFSALFVFTSSLPYGIMRASLNVKHRPWADSIAAL